MNRTTLFFALVVAVLAVAPLAVSNQVAQPPAEVQQDDALLTVGETVGLTELGDVYGITINPTWRTRNIYTVIKSCDKFVVLEDQNKTTQLRIPLWSIREVTVQATGVRSAP